MSDEQLAIDAKAGDHDAFDELFRRLYGGTRAICQGLLGDVEEAHDLTMEAFVRAYVAISTCNYNPKRVRRFRAWLFCIATNACCDKLRKNGRLPPIASVDDKTTGEQEADPEWADADVHSDPTTITDWLPVREAWNELSLPARVVLTRKYLAGQTWAEVADAMGCTVARARYLAEKAKQRLAEGLRRRGINP